MSQTLLGLLITQTIQVTLLAMIVWMVVRYCAKDRPHLAHALWLLVLIKCLTPPVWSSPTSPFCWFHQSQQLAKTERKESLEEASNPLPPMASTLLPPVVVHIDRRSQNQPAVSPEVSHHLSANSKPSAHFSQSSPWNWRKVFLGIWIGGAALGLLFTLIRFFIFLCWIKRSQVNEAPDAGLDIQPLLDRLGIRKKVRVLILGCPVGPAVLGLFRPTILLPSAIARGKSLQELEPLLAHELIHFRRGDLWWALVQSISKNLFWFHPLIRFAVHRVTQESERSCDEETVTSLGCKPAVYARGLLEVLEHKHRLRVAPALPGVRPVDITSARLERVMKLGNGSHSRTPLWIWCVVLVCALFVLPGAAWVSGQESENESAVMRSLPLVTNNAAVNQAQPSEELEIRVYKIDNLINMLREKGMSTEGFVQMFLPELSVANAAPSKPASGDPTGLAKEISQPHQEVPGARARLVDDSLIVVATPKLHERVSHVLTERNRLGFGQTVVNAHFVTVPREQLKELGIEWRVPEVVDGRRLASQVGSSTAMGKVNRIASSYGGVDADSNSGIRMTSFVERRSPEMLAFVTKDQFSQLRKRMLGDSRINWTQAPRVTVFNGQRASIVDGSERPFVVGMSRVQLEGDNRVLQPVVESFIDGMKVDLRTEEKGENVKLEFDVTLSEVVKVASFELPIAGTKKSQSIQLPEIATTRLSSSLVIPAGKMLGVCGLCESSQGEENAFLMFLTCQQLDPKQEGEKGATNAKEMAGQLDPNGIPYLKSLPILGRSFRTASAESQVPMLKSIPMVGDLFGPNQNSSDTSDAAVRIELAGRHFEIHGNAKCEIDSDRMLVQGDSLVISDKGLPGVFTLSADECQVAVERGVKMEVQCEGNAKLELEKFSLTADNLEMVQESNGDAMAVLNGNATLISDSHRLSAEKIRVRMNDGSYSVSVGGKAEYQTKGEQSSSNNADPVKSKPNANELNREEWKATGKSDK